MKYPPLLPSMHAIFLVVATPLRAAEPAAASAVSAAIRMANRLVPGSDKRIIRELREGAWPAKHGDSGIMTFLVNQQVRVYQKDLGEDTDRIARKMKSYDPDSTWQISID